MSREYLQVAVESPLPQTLTYLPLEGVEVAVGDSVMVPLGSRKVCGLVVGKTADAGEYKLKPILNRIEEKAPLSADYVKWGEWISNYYIHPPGQVFSLMFPPLLKKKGRVLKKNNSGIPEVVEKSKPPIFTKEQKSCIDAIEKSEGFSVHLIHGVTGSGKTEVYMKLIAQQVEKGRSALVLVPEISLTPQLVERFASRFPDQVAVIHSHLTNREKTNQWWSIVDGNKKILIGARSALFCPIDNLGIIVIDEEHEPSFKQEEKLKYHARDVAIMLSKIKNIPILLGSATPSLETWKNALTDKFHFHEMKNRVAERKMPNIEVVDMKDERQISNREIPFWLSEKLYQSLGETFEKKEQSILFLNRRGMAQTVLCSSCGYVYECPNCAISLTLHSKSHLVCHYCDYSIPFSEKCKECNELEIKPLGLGTELIEQDLQKLFPDARIARADRDEISNREQMEELIHKMEAREIDMLVGTQMIAKGLDFPHLTLVGIVMADVGFNMPNFRSSERSYHLITQVCGRAGRHIEEGGSVVIQTYNPDHTSIRHTLTSDFAKFCGEQLEFRKELFYPPFSKLVSFRFQGLDLKEVKQASDLMGQRANLLKSKYKEYEKIRTLGPAAAPLAKVRNKYRYHFLIKSSDSGLANQFSRQLVADRSWLPRRVKLMIDIDPMSML